MNILRKDIAIIFAAALLMAGCDKSDVIENGGENPPSDGVAISFSNPSETRAFFYTRADNATRATREPLKQNFMVNAIKTMSDNSTQTVMLSYVVKYISATDSYSYEDASTNQYLKFWDMSATRYSFSAVTPVVTGSDAPTVSFDGSNNISITNVTTDKDWMIARTVRDFSASSLSDFDSIANSQISTLSSKFAAVPLIFHHIFAKVIFKIYADEEMEIDPLEVGFSNTIIAPATYTSFDGWTNTTLAAEGYQKVYGATKTVIAEEYCDRDHALELASINVIPQQLDGDPAVTIIVQQDGNDQPTTLNIPGSWEAGKVYTYYLKFNGNNKVILIDISIDDWEKGEAIEDQTVDNW